MFSLQDKIFESRLSRIDLCSYLNSSKSNYKISIYRNHSFEMVEHTISIYLDYADVNAKFVYSDYDDTLTFFDLDLTADLVILWLDLSRYNEQENYEEFIKNRISYLRKIYKKTILFIPFGKKISISEQNIITYDLTPVSEELGANYLDERLEAFSGTKLSPKSSILISRDLGLNYIPSCLKTPIKAIVFDLDNTLYSGVLGEDGIDGVKLSEGHLKLQTTIVELSKKGFFICLASKNNLDDVNSLFAKRKDFPLQLKYITKSVISWNSKADSISQIIKFLNIGIKDLLFVDDNIGEIMTVKSVHPQINCILAKDDANITNNVINNFPRLKKFNLNYEDLIRQKDTQSNEERKKLQESLSKSDFLRSLDINIGYSFNNPLQINRISELSNKTNQFICAYKRYSVNQVTDMMNDADTLIISVSLKDKLSDSGIICCMFFVKRDCYIEIEECFVSCRALGRGIDDNIVLYPIELAKKHFGIDFLKLNFVKGERNSPAESFVDENLSCIKNTVNKLDLKITNDFVNISVKDC